jgi:formylglycine-generating enzyme
VTQGQYQAVMGDNPSSAVDCRDYGVRPKLPVFCVDFRQAVAFSNRLSTREGLTPCYSLEGSTGVRWIDRACNGYRLPTEAEWEYAARAGERWRYAGSDDPTAVAWFDENSEGKIHQVGTKNPNAWGLQDMSGNVWEWVWDWHAPYLTGTQRDPAGPETGSSRVVRGGSFAASALVLRVARRLMNVPSGRGGILGFRLSRSL